MNAERTALALRRLHLALAEPPATGVELGNWRWRMRGVLAGLRDALLVEAAGQPWGSPVNGDLLRERTALSVRLAESSRATLSDPDAAALRERLRQLLADVHEHVVRARGTVAPT